MKFFNHNFTMAVSLNFSQILTGANPFSKKTSKNIFYELLLLRRGDIMVNTSWVLEAGGAVQTTTLKSG